MEIHRIRLLLTVLWLTAANSVAAEAVCSGYNPLTQSWSRVGTDASFAAISTSCPPGHAYISVAPILGPHPAPEQVRVFGNCCPLPSDVLETEQVSTLSQCPEGFVATGASPQHPFDSNGCFDNEQTVEACQRRYESATHLLHCTKINESRYQLGPAMRGVALGWLKHFAVSFAPYTTRDKLPVAFRDALGRFEKMKWSLTVCVGTPVGSWLTGKSNKYCRGFSFRELQYRGATGDPPRGAPVRWWADCKALRNRMDPNPECFR